MDRILDVLADDKEEFFFGCDVSIVNKQIKSDQFSLNAVPAGKPPLKTVKMPITVDGKQVQVEVKLYKANSHNSSRRSKQCARCKRFLGIDKFSMRDVCVRCQGVVERVMSIGERGEQEMRLI